MVRENLVFRTKIQKVYYEDILRALRVSSFLCVFRTLDLICPSGRLYYKRSLCKIAKSLFCLVYICELITRLSEFQYIICLKIFTRRFPINFLIAFVRMCRYFVFFVIS